MDTASNAEALGSMSSVSFAVLDEDDLSVMSAHLQDAFLIVQDAAFLPKSKRFAAVVSRVDWHGIAEGQQRRRRAGFHFERVMRVRRTGFDQTRPEATLQLLAVSFTPTESPAGDVLLTFSGRNAIKLEVECLEAAMKDLGESFAVKDCPRHRLDEVAAER